MLSRDFVWTRVPNSRHSSRAGAGSSAWRPAGLLRAVRAALVRFREEDDVGNVLSCLHTGAQAVTLGGEAVRGATLLAAVRRHGLRRGLRPDLTDPVTTAALDAALGRALDPVSRAAADAAGEALDEAGMIVMLTAGQDQDHARR